MRLLIAVLLLCAGAAAQPVNPPPAILKGSPPGGAGGACTSTSMIGYLTNTGVLYVCPSGTNVWTASGGGGTTPGGVNAQAGDYTSVSGDCASKLITMNGTNKTFSFQAGPSSSCLLSVLNLNSSAAIVNKGSHLINGASTSISLAQYQRVDCSTNGTDWFCSRPLNAITGTGLGQNNNSYVQETSLIAGMIPQGTGANIAALPANGWTIFNGAVLNDFARTQTDIHVAPNSSLNMRGISRAVSVPYTLYASIQCIAANAYIDSQTCGVGVTDGTKYQGIEIFTQQGVADTRLRVENWNTVSSDNATVAGATAGLIGTTVAVKIVNDSTNRTYSYWSNGAWVQFFQTTTANFVSETSLYVSGLAVTNVATPVEVRLLYWSVQ